MTPEGDGDPIKGLTVALGIELAVAAVAWVIYHIWP